MIDTEKGRTDWGYAIYLWRNRTLRFTATFPRPHWDRIDPLHIRLRYWACRPVRRQLRIGAAR